MGSRLTLKNNIESEFNISHEDNAGAIEVSSYDLSRVKTVDTIAALRASNNPQPTVWVSGYHTKGDGAFGSNIFEWDSASTEADNGGTTIKLDSVATGRYKLRYGGAVNIKWFGAKSDASTCVSDIIQRVVRSSNISKKGLFIPQGSYLLTKTVLLSTQTTLFGEVPQHYHNSGRGTKFVAYSDSWTSGELTPMFRCSPQDSSSQAFVFTNINFTSDKDVPWNALYTSDEDTGIHAVDISGVRDGVEFTNCSFRNLHTAVIQDTSWTTNYLDKVTLSKCYAHVIHRFFKGDSTAGVSLDNCMIYDVYDWVDAGNSRVFSNATSYNNSSFSTHDCGIKGGMIHAIGNWFEAGNKFFQPSHSVVAESNYLGVAWDAVSPSSNKYVVAPREGCRYIKLVGNGIGSTNRIMAWTGNDIIAGIHFEFIANTGGTSCFSSSCDQGVFGTNAQSLGSACKLGMSYTGYNNDNEIYNDIVKPNVREISSSKPIGLIEEDTVVRDIQSHKTMAIALNSSKAEIVLLSKYYQNNYIMGSDQQYLFKIELIGDRNGGGGGTTYQAVYKIYKVKGASWVVEATGSTPTAWNVTINETPTEGVLQISIVQAHQGSVPRDIMYFKQISNNLEAKLIPNPVEEGQ